MQWTTLVAIIAGLIITVFGTLPIVAHFQESRKKMMPKSIRQPLHEFPASSDALLSTKSKFTHVPLSVRFIEQMHLPKKLHSLKTVCDCIQKDSGVNEE